VGLASALLLATFAAVPKADAKVETERHHYAIVVGNSTSLTPGVRPLDFADDDAARYAELFDPIAHNVRLLTVLDPDAQRIHPALATRAEAPSKKNVIGALGELYRAMEKDRENGHEVVFYFILIGHGEIGPGGEGFVSLLDAPFSRTDLYEEVIRRSPATSNHVIVDACNSYFLVNKRGADDGGPSRAGAVQSYLSQEELERFPNTGVVLSTSSAKESHEWSAYRAGVFSHEVRSALTGAADVSGDGRVDYSELHAFVAAANSRVEDPRARIDLYVRPPAIDVRMPLVDLRQARFTNYLSVPAGAPARFYLEDDRGVRYADVNLSGETATYLALVDRDFYWVRAPDEEREERFDLKQPGRIELDMRGMKPRKVAVRGSVGDTFQAKLFREPYGLEFYRGFAASQGYVPSGLQDGAWIPVVGELDSGDNGRTIGSIALWAAAAGLAGAGVIAHVQSRHSVDEFNSHLSPSGAVVGIDREDAQALERDARNWSWARNGLLIGAGAAVVGGLVVWFWPDDDATPSMSVSTDGTSLLVGGEF
jgi:hypothetical protein